MSERAVIGGLWREDIPSVISQYEEKGWECISVRCEDGHHYTLTFRPRLYGSYSPYGKPYWRNRK